MTPSGADDVTLNSGVTLTGVGGSVRSLTVQSGPSTLVFSGPLYGALDFEADCTLVGASLGPSVAISAGHTVTCSGDTGLSYAQLVNGGNLVLQGNLALNNASVQNQPGALIDFGGSTIGAASGGSGEIVNAGTLWKRQPGVATIGGSLTLKNTGSVQVDSGTLYLACAVTSSGSFEAANPGTLIFNPYPTGYNFQGAGGYGFGSGSRFLGNGLIQLAWNATANGLIVSSNLVLTAGSLVGTNTLAGVTDVQGGSLGGDTTVPTNSVLNLRASPSGGSVAVLHNLGLVVMSGPFQVGSLQNLPGATVLLTSDQTLNTTIDNAGLLRVEGPTNVLLAAGSALTNTGLVEVRSGSLSINGAGVSRGVFSNAAATATIFNPAYNSLSYSFETGTQFLGPGTNLLAGGTLPINGAVLSSNLVLAGANVSGVGTLLGSLTWSAGFFVGTTTVASASIVTTTGDAASLRVIQGALTNFGTLRCSGGDLLLNAYYAPGLLQNMPNALIDLAGNPSIVAGAFGGTLVNAGTVRKSGGTNSVIGVSFANTGLLDLQRGLLSLNGSSSFSPQSTLSITLGETAAGAGYAQLKTSAAFTLAGGLSLNLAPGFTPSAGETFQILSAPSVSGSFAALSGGYLGNGLYLVPSYPGNGVLVSATDATPRLSPASALTWTNNTWQLSLSGSPGYTYVIEASADLATWIPVATNVMAGSGALAFQDPLAASRRDRFYRVRLIP